MDKGTSRRGVLATIGAAMAAVVGWSFAPKLFGHSKREANMQTATQTTQTPRALQGVFAPGPEHWVGDGFYVKTVFWPQLGAQMLSPFLLLDHGRASISTPRPGGGAWASIRTAVSRR